jgi:hypothetical protein
VPSLLRAAGLRLVTLAEHYGIPADEAVEDTDWLALAGSRGWVVFMKDARVRYNPAEREAVEAHSVRCFRLSSQSLTAVSMAARYLDNLGAIASACRAPGPLIYAVHATRIERLPLRGREAGSER